MGKNFTTIEVGGHYRLADGQIISITDTIGDRFLGSNGKIYFPDGKVQNEHLNITDLNIVANVDMQGIFNRRAVHNYEMACQELVKQFSLKHDLEFDGWVGDDIGGIASFIDQYFFSMDDIALDLKTDQPKHSILRWQDDNVEHAPEFINYKSYTMGLRQSDLNKEKP